MRSRAMEKEGHHYELHGVTYTGRSTSDDGEMRTIVEYVVMIVSWLISIE